MRANVIVIRRRLIRKEFIMLKSTFLIPWDCSALELEPSQLVPWYCSILGSILLSAVGHLCPGVHFFVHQHQHIVERHRIV